MMTTGQRVEKILMIANWILAAISGVMTFLFGAVGGMFGLLSFLDKGNLGGHEWTIGMALVWGVVTGLFIAAALGMKLNKQWKWYVQVSPPVAFVGGSALVFLIAG